MSEQKLNDHLKSIMKHDWIGTRLESPLTNNGLPDWAFTLKESKVRGFIESKFISKWPIRPRTLVKLYHFIPAQKNWLWNQGSVGGHVFVILQVANEVFVYDWGQVYDIGNRTQAQLRQHAIFSWTRGVDKTRTRKFKNQFISILLDEWRKK